MGVAINEENKSIFKLKAQSRQFIVFQCTLLTFKLKLTSLFESTWIITQRDASLCEGQKVFSFGLKVFFITAAVLVSIV